MSFFIYSSFSFSFTSSSIFYSIYSANTWALAIHDHGSFQDFLFCSAVCWHIPLKWNYFFIAEMESFKNSGTENAFDAEEWLCFFFTPNAEFPCVHSYQHFNPFHFVRCMQRFPQIVFNKQQITCEYYSGIRTSSWFECRKRESNHYYAAVENLWLLFAPNTNVNSKYKYTIY